MNDKPVKLLLVDDDEDDYIVTRDLLAEVAGRTYQLERVATYDAALEAIGRRQHDVCLIDYRLGERNGLELLREGLASGCQAPMILLTGQGDHEVDLEAMKAGASDYLVKDQISAPLLERSIRYAIERKRAENELHERHIMMVESLNREKSTSMALESTMKQLETATQAKSEFLANMSHEIRTPMTAILGFTDNLLDPELSDSDRLNAIQTIRRNGGHLLQIINDILDISKIEAGKLQVEHIQCSPIQVVAEVHSLMQVRANGKNLKFDIDYIGPVPETIRSDPTRLKQILVNLVGNSIKFTEAGSVRLVTRFVNDRHQPFMQYDVLDTGLGMTEEQVVNLFKPFSQADASTTRKYGGTGLGLTISKRLATLLGGDITLMETKPGIGTRVRITAATGPLDGVKMVQDPLAATVVTADAREEREKAVWPALEGCRILLAEDGPDNQRLISYILNKAGANVTVAENGKLAVEATLAAMFQRRQDDPKEAFDAILMDMQMPVMDGYDATHLLRQQGYPGPIIALTAHAMATDRDECIKAGCDDYVSKPIDQSKLTQTIHQHLHRKHDQANATESTPNVLVSELADNPDMAELVETFIAELPDKVAAIEEALTSQDFQTLARIAHQLKGSAGGYGFPAITAAAKCLETSVKAQEDVDKLRVAVDTLAGLCQRARARVTTGVT